MYSWVLVIYLEATGHIVDRRRYFNEQACHFSGRTVVEEVDLLQYKCLPEYSSGGGGWKSADKAHDSI